MKMRMCLIAGIIILLCIIIIPAGTFGDIIRPETELERAELTIC